MRSMNRQRGRQGGRRMVALGAMWLVIGGTTAGFGAAVYKMMTAPPDVLALCQAGTSYAASAAIILDLSDELTPAQRQRALRTVGEERAQLPLGGVLTLLALAPDAASDPPVLVSVCNPGDPHDANPFWQTTQQVEAAWTQSFAAPIDAAVADALKQPPTSNSLIMRSIAGALARADFDTRTAHRRLVLVSDMLEHDDGYSQLQGGNLWNDYLKSALPHSAPLQLSGVDIAIDYLARPAHAEAQGPVHRNFWRRLFASAGATSVTFIGLGPDPDDPPHASERASKKSSSKKPRSKK